MTDHLSKQGAASRGLIQFTHRDERGSMDYWGVLTVQFGREAGQWVGLCHELGTAAHADTLAQVESELREAIGLQLNEMARISDVREYLADNRVSLAPVAMPQATGFAVTGGVLAA